MNRVVHRVKKFGFIGDRGASDSAGACGFSSSADASDSSGSSGACQSVEFSSLLFSY